MTHISHTLARILLVLSSLVIISCGGGGGGGGGGSPTPTVDNSLSGTTAAGAPMAGALVTVYDRYGQTASTYSDENGNFRFNDVSSLTRPLLLVATGNLGGVETIYMSLLLNNAGNRANITPMTDAVVVQATGQRGPSALIQAPALLASIQPSKVQLSASNIANVIRNVLEQLLAGSSTGFDPMGSSFVANGRDPYDKVHDLFVTTIIPRLNGSIDITLRDKTGGGKNVVIQENQETTQLQRISGLPASVTSLQFDKLKEFFSTFNAATGDAATLTTGTAFAELFSASYSDYGQSKDDLLSLTPSPFLHAKLTNPLIRSCTSEGNCLVTFKQSYPGQAFTQGEFKLRWDNTAGKWLSIGHGSDDLIIDFDTFAQFNKNDSSISTALTFNIRNRSNSLPFQSAVATFSTSTGTADLTLNFQSKAACENNSNATRDNGLPLAAGGSSTCESWQFFTTSDEMNQLKQINEKILAGGYQLKVRANLKSSPSTYVEVVQPLTQPFVTSDQVDADSFPQVTVNPGSGQNLPSLSISNAGDFSTAGYICLSTFDFSCATVSGQKTSYITDNLTRLTSPIRPLQNDSWSASDTIDSWVLTARDRHNRKLRVVQ